MTRPLTANSADQSSGFFEEDITADDVESYLANLVALTMITLLGIEIRR